MIHHSAPFYHPVRWIIVSCFLLLSALSRGQCSSSPFKPGTSFSNSNIFGASSFLNPSNLSGDDNLHAISWATLSLLGSAKTDYLVATNFNFALPPTATVCGITATIKKKATGVNLLNWITDEEVRLVKAGHITGSNKATNTLWSLADQTETYGGTVDKWGATLTATDVNHPDFGIAIAAGYHGLVGVLLAAEIDYIQVQVHYNVVLPFPVVSFEGYSQNGTVHLSWRLPEQTPPSTLHLQRSMDGMAWETIKTYSFAASPLGIDYQFIDASLPGSLSYYRLQIENLNGEAMYSKILSFSPVVKKDWNLYPNPVQKELQIRGISGPVKVRVFNLAQQPIPVAVRSEGGGFFIDVSTLSRGLYFIKINEETKRFLKE